MLNSMSVSVRSISRLILCRTNNPQVTYSKISKNFASYKASKTYNSEEKVDFEILREADEWKYVARLLPKKYIPDPVIKDSYPSGWKPQSPEALKGPYYVKRSRNHLLPVYLTISQRGLQKRTYVRHVLGDIWLFSEDLKNYLQDKIGVSVGLRVDEVGNKVVLRGDYVHFTNCFLSEKGL